MHTFGNVKPDRLLTLKYVVQVRWTREFWLIMVGADRAFCQVGGPALETESYGRSKVGVFQ